jgi:hypothetical protein
MMTRCFVNHPRSARMARKIYTQILRRHHHWGISSRAPKGLLSSLAIIEEWPWTVPVIRIVAQFIQWISRGAEPITEEVKRINGARQYGAARSGAWFLCHSQSSKHPAISRTDHLVVQYRSTLGNFKKVTRTQNGYKLMRPVFFTEIVFLSSCLQTDWILIT